VAGGSQATIVLNQGFQPVFRAGMKPAPTVPRDRLQGAGFMPAHIVRLNSNTVHLSKILLRHSVTPAKAGVQNDLIRLGFRPSPMTVNLSMRP
jgi:hypothetical protein